MWLFDLGFCSGLRVVGFGGFVTWRLFGGLGLGSRSRGLGPQVGTKAIGLSVWGFTSSLKSVPQL